MKNLLIFSFLFLSLNSTGQTLGVKLRKINPSGWPFVWDIQFDQDSTLWAGGDVGGLFYKTKNSENFVKFPVPSSLNNSEIRAISVLTSKDIWIAAEGQGLFHYNGTEWKKFDLTSGIPALTDWKSIVRDLSGNIWFANNGKGILQYNGTTWKNFKVSNSGMKSDYVTELIIANDGKIWAGADEQLMIFNGNTWSSRNLDNEFQFRTWVNSFFKDNQGRIWIATDKGILLHENGVIKAKSEFGNLEFQSIAIDKKGILWLVEIFVGIWRFDGATGKKFTEADDPIIPTQCWEILISEKNEKLMIGNRGSNLIEINDDGFYSSTASSIEGTKILVYPNPTNGILYVDSELEILKYKLIKIDGQLYKEESLNDNQGKFQIEIGNVLNNQKIFILQLSAKNGEVFNQIVYLE